MPGWIEKIKEIILAALAMGQFVYLLMRGKNSKLEAEKEQLELKLEYSENEKRVKEENKNLSSDDIIDKHLKS